MTNSAKWILVRRVGDVLENLDGTVRSLNPSHNEAPFAPYRWQTRPKGTAGGYERVAVNGGTVAYNPTGQEVVVFGFQAAVPHSDGLSAMTEDPL